MAEICRRLDGLPLGIEIAASRMALLPARDIAERLGQEPGPAWRGLTRCARAAADAPGGDRLELRPPARSRATAARAAVGVRRRVLRCRGRGGLRSGRGARRRGHRRHLGAGRAQPRATGCVDRSEHGSGCWRRCGCSRRTGWSSVAIARTSGDAMPRPTWQSPRRSRRSFPGRARRSCWIGWPRSTTTSGPPSIGRSQTARSSSRSVSPPRRGGSGRAAGTSRRAGRRSSASSPMPGADAPTPGAVGVLDAAGGVAWWMGDIRTADRFYAEQVEVARGLGEPRALANALFNLATRGSSATIPARARRSGPRRSASSRRSAMRAARHASAGSPQTCSSMRDPAAAARQLEGLLAPVCRARRRLLRRDGERNAVVGHDRDGRSTRLRFEHAFRSFELAAEARDIGAATIAIRVGGDRAPAARPSSTGGDPRGSVRGPEQAGTGSARRRRSPSTRGRCGPVRRSCATSSARTNSRRCATPAHG